MNELLPDGQDSPRMIGNSAALPNTDGGLCTKCKRLRVTLVAGKCTECLGSADLKSKKPCDCDSRCGREHQG